MKSKRLLQQIGNINDRFIEEAEPAEGASKGALPVILRLSAAAACIALIAGAVHIIPKLRSSPAPTPTQQAYRSEARIIFENDALTDAERKAFDDLMSAPPPNYDLVYFTEEEMFSMENMYIFRGTVTDITNVLIDFSSDQAETVDRREDETVDESMLVHDYKAMCVVEVSISKVYRGENIKPGDSIKMLLGFPIVTDRSVWFEDTGLAQSLRVGTAGIFMPRTYDDSSFYEINNAKLYLTDLAPCGLGDGVRWMFLTKNDKFVSYAKSAYPSAGVLMSLDDAEEYILKMLDKYN